MKHILEILKATIIGGVFFILPLYILVIILGKIIKQLTPMVNLIFQKPPFQSVLSIILEYVIIILLLLMLSFLVGIIARIKVARSIINWLEDALLGKIPGYTFMKESGEYVYGVKESTKHKVILVMDNECWSLAFEIEAVDEDYVIVFLPGAPNPLNGEVKIVSRTNCRKIDMDYKDALSFSKKMGHGYGIFFRGKLGLLQDT